MIISLLAALSVILMIELVGFVDDIVGIRQHIKLLLPLAAALPLIALKVTAMETLAIPFIGALPIPSLVYLLILVPIGITAATNLTNTFAGFNGMEAGMGAVIAAVLLALGWHMGIPIVMMLSAALFGSLLAFLIFNRYPSKIFPDDVGTLLIGCMIGVTVILGRIEVAGVIMLLPHIIDFVFFKVPNRLPQEVAQPWTSVLREGNKLYPPKKSVTFAQWLMVRFNGLTEKNLTLLLVEMEIVLGIIVLGIYW
jgi:UDP-N-acetylglucosamine--dolichyl-phosphate N-acetylglucosaminephosphotransferase